MEAQHRKIGGLPCAACTPACRTGRIFLPAADACDGTAAASCMAEGGTLPGEGVPGYCRSRESRFSTSRCPTSLE